MLLRYMSSEFDEENDDVDVADDDTWILVLTRLLTTMLRSL